MTSRLFIFNSQSNNAQRRIDLRQCSEAMVFVGPADIAENLHVGLLADHLILVRVVGNEQVELKTHGAIPVSHVYVSAPSSPAQAFITNCG